MYDIFELSPWTFKTKLIFLKLHDELLTTDSRVKIDSLSMWGFSTESVCTVIAKVLKLGDVICELFILSSKNLKIRKLYKLLHNFYWIHVYNAQNLIELVVPYCKLLRKFSRLLWIMAITNIGILDCESFSFPNLTVLLKKCFYSFFFSKPKDWDMSKSFRRVTKFRIAKSYDSEFLLQYYVITSSSRSHYLTDDNNQ